MKSFHWRIAQLWYKQKTRQKLTRTEATEWKECLTANMYQHDPSVPCELVLANMWANYLKYKKLSYVEYVLWQRALDQVLDRYIKRQQLMHLAEIVRRIGDKQWDYELQTQLKELSESPSNK